LREDVTKNRRKVCGVVKARVTSVVGSIPTSDIASIVAVAQW